MNKTVVSEGAIRLRGNGGVKDKRNNRVHSEYVGDEKNEIFFDDAEPIIVEETPAPKKKSSKK